MALATSNPFDYLSKLGIPGAVVLAVILLYVLAQILPSLKAVAALFQAVFKWFRPSRYGRSNRSDLLARQRIARLLLQNLDFLEEELHWQRENFADIRVTIEARDTPESIRSRLLPFRRSSIAYRTHSLSKALQRERERIVLIQGPPGSGKSVAVRHFARVILERAEKARFKQRPLALCVSLRDFTSTAENVTAKGLREYITDQVNAQEASELAHYLDEMLEADIASGNVIILLDSFDEIPAVFGTQQIDTAVIPYVKAITGLMGGGPAQCVVSSREYKGPRVPGWTRLELLGLSFNEQVRLLSKYGLNERQIELVDKLLLDPRTGFSTDMRSPLQLALLASFVRANDRPPDRPSELFDDYVATCIKEAALGERPSIATLTPALQAFAFGLMKRPDAGLSTNPDELRANLMKQTEDYDAAEGLMEIAKRSKLLIETPARQHLPPRLAFAHRRVQEYFATQYVRSHPANLPPRELAQNPRWRETAVTLLQVSTPADQPQLLNELLGSLNAEEQRLGTAGDEDFEWGPLVIHTLELLVAAYGSRPQDIPEDIADSVSRLVDASWKDGTISDRKFALDCLPTAPSERQPELIDKAFRGQSDWLRMAALRDCSTLHPLPTEIDQAIRRLLITLLGGGRLSRQGKALDGDLRRLYKGQAFVRMRKILAVTPIVLLGVCALRVAYDYFSGAWTADVASVRFEVFWWIFFPFAIFWIFQATEPLSFRPRSTARRLFGNVMKRSFGWQVEEFETETLGLLLVGIVAIDGLGSFVQSALGAIDGRYPNAAMDLLLGPLLAAYALAWGPSMLAAVHQGWFSADLRLREAVLVFRRSIPEAYSRASAFAGPLVKIFAIGVLIQVVGGAVIFGIYYALTHLAGNIGYTLAGLMRWALLGIVPAIILYTLIRELRSRRRVKRSFASRDQLTPATLIEILASFGEPSETSAYLELLRIRRAEEARQLPRPFIRQLIRLIEAIGDPNISLPDAGELNPALRASLQDKKLTATVLASWRGEVLDQLGQLDEFMRER